MSQYRSWLMVLVLAVQGCAMHSPDPCRSTDWYALGYQDASAGRLAEPQRSCPGGVTEPALSQYQLGRQAGLQEYCKADNGFRLGIDGQPYQGICAAAVETDFLRAYQEGKQVHDVEAQIRRLAAILEVNESERDSLGLRIRQKQTELGQGRVGLESHAVLRAELRELEETEAMVAAEIDAIQAALHEHRAQLAQLRQTGQPR